MLTVEDKKWIREVVVEVVQPLDKKLDAVINFFDGEHLRLERRVSHIESILHSQKLT